MIFTVTHTHMQLQLHIHMYIYTFQLEGERDKESKKEPNTQPMDLISRLSRNPCNPSFSHVNTWQCCGSLATFSLLMTLRSRNVLDLTRSGIHRYATSTLTSAANTGFTSYPGSHSNDTIPHDSDSALLLTMIFRLRVYAFSSITPAIDDCRVSLQLAQTEWEHHAGENDYRCKEK